MFKHWIGLIALVALGAGCPNAGHGGFGNAFDSGGGDFGPRMTPDFAGTDGGGGAGDVTGTGMNNWITEAGIVPIPIDFSKQTIAALVPMGQGFTTIPGTGKADGTFVIPNVPAVTWYLQWGSSYVVTDRRSLDLSLKQL